MTESECVVCGNHYSRHFLLAQSYLTTGEIDKATDHFLIAADGLSKQSRVYVCAYMRRLCMCSYINVSRYVYVYAYVHSM